MKLNFLLVFLTLLTSYSCDKSITYLNYGDDIDIELSYSENIEDNFEITNISGQIIDCLLYTSPSPRDNRVSRMPSSA